MPTKDPSWLNKRWGSRLFLRSDGQSKLRCVTKTCVIFICRLGQQSRLWNENSCIIKIFISGYEIMGNVPRGIMYEIPCKIYPYYLIKSDIIEISKWHLDFIQGNENWALRWRRTFYLPIHCSADLLPLAATGCVSRWAKCNLFVKDYAGLQNLQFDG